MQDKTTAIKEVSECIGLKVHPGKSKVMRVKTPSTEPILLGEEALEDVESFTYLGSVIDKKGGVTADIRSRIGKARQNFGRLKPVWRSRKLTTKTKLRIFNSNIKAVLLYGSDRPLESESGNFFPGVGVGLPTDDHLVCLFF